MTTTQLNFSTEAAFRAVLDWIEAVNFCDAEKLLALSAQDIQMIGPRGTTSGHQVLIDWLNQAGMRFLIQCLELTDKANTLVRPQAETVKIQVRHQAIWTSTDGQNSQVECLSIFTLAYSGLTQPQIRAYERRVIS